MLTAPARVIRRRPRRAEAAGRSNRCPLGPYRRGRSPRDKNQGPARGERARRRTGKIRACTDGTPHSRDRPGPQAATGSRTAGDRTVTNVRPEYLPLELCSLSANTTAGADRDSPPARRAAARPWCLPAEEECNPCRRGHMPSKRLMPRSEPVQRASFSRVHPCPGKGYCLFVDWPTSIACQRSRLGIAIALECHCRLVRQCVCRRILSSISARGPTHDWTSQS